MIDWLSGWYNWPFLLPLAFGVLLAAADVLLGGLSDLLGLEGDAELDGARFTGLLWLGMGKVPITILVEVLCISFGATGLLVNAIAFDLAPVAWGATLSFPLALAAAVTVSPVVTRGAAGLVSAFAPARATTSRSPEYFLSEIGVVSSRVTASIGQVTLTSGDRRTILNARRDERVSEDLPRGTEVVIVGYDRASNLYTVAPVKLP